MAEFDRVGRQPFLAAAGFGPAKNYYLEVDGQLYDSKAIVGYAHGISGDRPWRAEDFSGGDKTVADLLRSLNFEVRFIRNPNWTRDEIVLVCALVERKGWRSIAQEDPKAIALSELLQGPAIHPLDGRAVDFRNPAGVERKSNDLVTRHSSSTARRTNGNRLDQVVVDAFEARPSEMQSEAAAIEAALRRWPDEARTLPDPDLVDLAGREGGVLLKEHLLRERDATLKPRKIEQAKKQGKLIACEACGFDFLKAYGDRGRDYIECHHRTPLHVTGPVETRLQDLALICSNCHRMIHRTSPWLTVDELAKLVSAARRADGPQ
ncbi:HNH endonuclease [Actinoplanes regularis]|uniref:HNH endonuclease n=1 Tax=Actinoplanes regularis TaxID=52697 RepID=UPI0025547669|nr:HNH endonuclease [Actinoplanes regularis]